MGQVRSATWVWLAEVEAGVPEEEYRSNLLRDILPDQAFEILWMRLGMITEVGQNDLIMFEVAKNIVPKAAGHLDTFLVTHGHLWWIEEVHSVAENVYEMWHHQIVFDQPVEFDKDDQLNIRMYVTNTGTSIYAAEWVLTVGYRVR